VTSTTPVITLSPRDYDAALLISLAALGALAARAGGASASVGAGRVALWGALAMAVTAAVGALFGTTVG
jgi:VIT1/CCC1 family predicted Fe2+/Mn2+ transporter